MPEHAQRGRSVSHRPKIAMLILKPLPGERRKSALILMYEKEWRSKWWRVHCTGTARKCLAGECAHVRYAVDNHPRGLVRSDRGVVALNAEASQ